MLSRLKSSKNKLIGSRTKKDIYPKVYELAEFLALRSGATHVIDIGVGNPDRLALLAEKFRVIAITQKTPDNHRLRDLPDVKFITADVNRYLPGLEPKIIKKSVIISSVKTSKLKDLDKYLGNLAKLSEGTPYILIPDNEKSELTVLDSKANELGFKGRMSGLTVFTETDVEKNVPMIIAGTEAYPNLTDEVDKIKITAIVTVYNENEIIDQVLVHLIDQGVSVHVIDNWSDDGSYETVQNIAGHNEHVTFEKFPVKKPKYYEWGKVLERVEEVASENDSNWFIHYDADELRVSPWQNVSLSKAISFVDGLGYNALDFTIVDFRPTKDGFTSKDSLVSFFEYCEFGERPGHFIQVKAWKNIGQKVEIASSGGHEAVFEGRKIYPVKFLTKHYPLRSSEQAKRKIFGDRLPRIAPEEKKKGWHIQYNNYDKKSDFIWPQKPLKFFYSMSFPANYLIELISGIGINRQE